jgi:hypothetical protein
MTAYEYFPEDRSIGSRVDRDAPFKASDVLAMEQTEGTSSFCSADSWLVVLTAGLARRLDGDAANVLPVVMVLGIMGLRGSRSM